MTSDLETIDAAIEALIENPFRDGTKNYTLVEDERKQALTDLKAHRDNIEPLNRLRHASQELAEKKAYDNGVRDGEGNLEGMLLIPRVDVPEGLKDALYMYHHIIEPGMVDVDYEAKAIYKTAALVAGALEGEG